ncbi:MAG: redox-sensing transcriptional repressor Rex [Actinomycetota bacterium]
MNSGSISDATVGRLPRYLRALVDLASTEQAATISSDHLAELVGVNPATVRRDLASLGITGTRGVGYDVKYLVYEISVELGLNQEWPVVVVGAGNLGRALANYSGLAERGFPIRYLIDVDTAKVGTIVSGLTVRHLDDLPRLVEAEGIAVGVIATPASGAQDVADALIGAGITSILNFTAHPIVTPAHVVVRRVDLATEMQILSFYQQRGSGASTGAGLPLRREEP